jgi:hypothetical protein
VTTLKGELMAWTERPTPAQLQDAADSRQELETLVVNLNDLLTKGLPELYDGLAAQGLNPPERLPIPPVEIR